jgi:hypothetical protein
MKITDIVFDRLLRYDILIATCGYERRSSYICRLGIEGDLKFAIIYPDTNGGSYLENRSLYTDAAWTLTSLEEVLLKAESSMAQQTAPLKVGIDISSMPRHVIGRIVEWMLSSTSTSKRGGAISYYFLYCPGEFSSSAQAAQRDGALSAAPISPFFAGELRMPSIPIGLILGLGLEPHRAFGVMEFLEPAKVWLFAGRSGDIRFLDAASSVHESLLDSFDEDDLYSYDVRSLEMTYSMLESLCFSSGRDYRLLMAPSGPKIFSLACFLVAARRVDDRPAVWRVGNANAMVPMEVVEAGDVSSAVVSLDS